MSGHPKDDVDGMADGPVAAILVAAGAGVRMGLGVPKAFIDLAGRPMAAWSIDALRASDRVDEVIVVVPAGGVEEARAILGAGCDGVRLVPGGASRAASVRAGVAAAGLDTAVILVHDAARPLLTPALIAHVLDGVADGAVGAIAAAPVADTVKAATPEGTIGATVPREGLWGAQTPQAFRAAPFRAALDRAAERGELDAATDCASLVEAVGGTVRLVAAGAPNLKVTTPPDRVVAAALLTGGADASPVH